MAAIWVRVEDESARDELRNLSRWLSEEPDLYGHVSLIERPEPEALGSVTDVLQMVLSAGVAGSAATVLVTWLRTRHGTLKMKLTRADGATLELSATGTKLSNNDGTDALVKMTMQFLNGAEPGEESGDQHKRIGQ
ncbi:hypothetical protein AB0392_12315 [Nonomuraea angiospora]|uniref:effector-associated constant component EACC1 n=1 Tax=Nonomuraea angiospora TaxID=46172 RepID=UPI00344B454F